MSPNVVNISQYSLSQTEIAILSKGLKFCPTPLRVDEFEVRKDVKAFSRRLRLQEYFRSDDVDNDDEDHEYSKNPFRTPSSWDPPKSNDHNLEAYIEHTEQSITSLDFSVNHRHNNITKEERSALYNLRDNSSIVIKEADKGSAVIVMDSDTYRNEALRQLRNENTYKALASDTTQTIASVVNGFVKNMHRGSIIDEETCKYLLADKNNVRPAPFYLLPKVHKQGVPGRPVVSGCGTPTERLSHWVDYHLKPLVEKFVPSYIKDTSDFLRSITDHSVTEEIILFTVDVVALYPSISIEEGIKAVHDFLGDHPCDVDRDVICEAIKLVLSNNVCKFDNSFFLQISGTAIGTRLAPSFANIYMHMLETNVINESTYKPSLWKRFIDDGFGLWEHGLDKLMDFIDLLNSVDPNIHFTFDYSFSDINFLDVKVYKSGNRLCTDLFTKPTDTHQYLHFSSCHPLHT